MMTDDETTPQAEGAPEAPAETIRALLVRWCGERVSRSAFASVSSSGAWAALQDALHGADGLDARVQTSAATPAADVVAAWWAARVVGSAIATVPPAALAVLHAAVFDETGLVAELEAYTAA